MGIDEPKNILDAVEDDLAAAGQEPKLFLGMAHYIIRQEILLKTRRI